MDIFRVAWRNIWRNRRRSFATITAMAVALLFMLLYSGLVEGYLASMERNITDIEVGDVQIFAPGYRDKPSIYTRIENAETILARLDQAGLPATARLLAPSLVAGKDASSGAMLHGIDVARDKTVSAIFAQVQHGLWLDPDRPQEIVVGRTLARTLDVRAGDDVVMLTQGADGSMANDRYVVRGILKSVSEPTDRAGVFMTTEAFRNLMVFPRGAHKIIVRRLSHEPLSETGQSVRQIVEDYDVKTWKQILPTLADLMESQRATVTIMFLIVYIAIGMVLLNAMLMAVFERIRELGVMKALGMSPWMVLRLIFMECALMALVAIIVGGSVSLPGMWYLSHYGIDIAGLTNVSVSGIAMDPVWRATYPARAVVAPIATFLIIVTAAAVYPAVKAATLEPVDAIRHR